ncbi:MAG: hypothetical protein NVSMB23_15370 [Myxococcales bacterium]
MLGRHGQRLLAGLGLLALVVLFAARFVRPLAPGLPVAGVLMIVGGGVALAIGVLRAELATAATLGILCALAGGGMAVHVGHVPWVWGALSSGVPAFFAALAFYAGLAVALPPLAAAIALTLGLARLSGPRHGSFALPFLAGLPWAVALALLLAALFLPLSVARERRRARKRSRKTRADGDGELEAKIARDRKRLAPEEPPVSDPDA